MSSISNGVYYFIGNITNHVVHALPLYEQMGGTFVVTSRKAARALRRYNIPVVCVTNRPYRLQRAGRWIKPIHEYIVMDRSLKKTYDFLQKNARVVIFYELFDIQYPEWLNRPKKVFIPHGNMLKSYMTMHPKRLDNILRFDYMAALSPYMRQRFIEDGVPDNKLVDISIARTDILLSKQKNQSKIRKKVLETLDLPHDKPLIFYAPTFWGHSSVYHTGVEIVQSVSKKYTLIFRPHPQTPRKILIPYQLCSAKKDNVKIVGSKSTISLEDLLIASDVVIVDRSSIALEAILLKKPMVFAYDTQNVVETPDYVSIRELVSACEKITRSEGNAINTKIDAALTQKIDQSTWNTVIARVWFQSKGGATKKIVEFIKKLKPNSLH